jgi:hypothetical protein
MLPCQESEDRCAEREHNNRYVLDIPLLRLRGFDVRHVFASEIYQQQLNRHQKKQRDCDGPSHSVEAQLQLDGRVTF